MRDKESQLVRTATERIRRAQILGKPNVRLSQLEYEALERQRERERQHGGPSAQPSRRQPASRPRTSDSRFRDDRPGTSREVVRSSGAAKAIYDPEYSPYLSGVGPVGHVDYALDRSGSYPPLEYRPPRRKPSSSTLSRPSSSRESLPHTPPSPAQRDPRPQARYFSLPEQSPSSGRTSASHSRTRSRSSAQAPYSADPMQYPIYPSQASYTPNPRGASDPINSQHGPVRRRPASSSGQQQQRPPYPEDIEDDSYDHGELQFDAFPTVPTSSPAQRKRTGNMSPASPASYPRRKRT